MVETTALEAAKSPDPKSGEFPLTLRLDKMGISTQVTIVAILLLLNWFILVGRTGLEPVTTRL